MTRGAAQFILILAAMLLVTLRPGSEAVDVHLLGVGWHVQDIVAAIVLASLSTYLLYGLFPQHPGRMLGPGPIFWFAVYVVMIACEMARTNLAAAYRVLHVDAPIRPGIVRVTTRLQSEMAKTFLANSITMSRDTLTVDIVGQNIYVHCQEIPASGAEGWSEGIVGRFEWVLERIFE